MCRRCGSPMCHCEYERAEEEKSKACIFPLTEPMRSFREADVVDGIHFEACLICRFYHDSHGAHCDLHPVRESWPPRTATATRGCPGSEVTQWVSVRSR